MLLHPLLWLGIWAASSLALADPFFHLVALIMFVTAWLLKP